MIHTGVGALAMKEINSLLEFGENCALTLLPEVQDFSTFIHHLLGLSPGD